MKSFAVLLLPFWLATTAPRPEWPQELRPLLQALQRARYSVMLKPPPIKGAYGLTDSRKRHIWIAPITHELGILKATLIHEAVHAAQGCPKGEQLPIGWPLQLQPNVDQTIRGLLYQGYPRKSYDIEREAFGMQSHPRAIPLVIAALDQRCR